MLGAMLGGLIAAVLGRNAVFVLNAFSFLASALLIGGMRFEERHAKSAPPLRLRDLLDYSPMVEGVSYVRRDFRLMGTVSSSKPDYWSWDRVGYCSQSWQIGISPCLGMA